MNFDKSDLWTGAFVLAAAMACLAALATINRERLTAETYHAEIHLPNIAGIDKGGEVVYQGYRAGIVDKVTIAYEPQFHFIVRMAIKKELRLKAGTSVIARAKGFGGAKYLELLIPSGGDDGVLLEEGAILPAVRESDLMAKAHEVMGELEKVARQFQKEDTARDIAETIKHANLSLAKLETTLAGVNAILEENRAAFKGTLQQTHGMAGRANDLIEKRQAALEQSLENLNRSLSHLPAILVNVEELTSDLKRRPWRLLRRGDGGVSPELDHRHPSVSTSTAPAKAP